MKDPGAPKQLSWDLVKESRIGLTALEEQSSIDVYPMVPTRTVTNKSGEVKKIDPHPAKHKIETKRFDTYRDLEDWCYQQSQTLVGGKASLILANESYFGRRGEWNFHRTNHIYLDFDGGDGDGSVSDSDSRTFTPLFEWFRHLQIDASFAESSSSVRRRTTGERPTNSAPSKWHVQFKIRPRLNPMLEVYPAWETEFQRDQRWAQLPEEEVKELRNRAGYLLEEEKRKTRFVQKIFSALGGLDLASGGPGFDKAVTQLCQPRYLGLRYAEKGPAPVFVMTGGRYALDLDRLCELAGYEPEVYVTAADKNPKIIRSIAADGTVVTFARSGGYDEMYNEVRNAISMAYFLGTFAGISPDSVSEKLTHWTCAALGHPSPEPRTLVTRDSNKWDGDQFRCYGDCDTTGDVIKYAGLCFGVGYHQAAVRLAKHLGLDYKAYAKERLTALSPEISPVKVDQSIRIRLTAGTQRVEELAVAPVDENKEVAEKERKEILAVHESRLGNVARWIAKHSPRFENSQTNFQRALVKVIALVGGADVNVIASTLAAAELPDLDVKQITVREAALYNAKTNSTALVVRATAERARNNLGTIGVGFLKKHVGTSELFDLASAFRKDGLGYKTAFKYLVGIARTEGPDRGFLESQWLEHSIDPGRMANPEEKGSDEYTKHEKRRETFQRALRRPGACGECGQRQTGEGGRALGPPGEDGKPTHLERRIVCVSKICMYCMVLLSVSESEILEDMWKDKVSKQKPVWIVQGTIEKVSYVAEVKEKLSRLRDAKLTILGWGSDYKPQLTVFVNTPEAALSVESALWSGQTRAARRVSDERPKDQPCKTWRVTDSSKAVGIALEARLSFNIHGKRLVEEQKEDDLGDWLWWAIGKTPVRNPRKEEALHWPTKDQVLAQVKANKGESWEPDLWPGEVSSFEVFHYKTRFVLARRKKIPYGIDEVATLMKTNMSFRHVESMRVAAERRAKGLKAAIDLDNHRMPLRGAVAVSA